MSEQAKNFKHHNSEVKSVVVDDEYIADIANRLRMLRALMRADHPKFR